MKILLVTNMFPTETRPNYGVFVKEQMEAVVRYYPDVDYELYYIDNKNGNKAYLSSIIRINNKINRGNYDIVHVHYGLSGLFLLNPFRRWKVPVIMTLHGGDIQPEQGKTIQVALTRMILRHVDAAITLNDRMTELVSGRCRNVVKIACSVDTDIFTPSENKHVLPCQDRRIRLLFPSDPGRAVKNYPLFQDVVSVLERKYNLSVDTECIVNMNRKQVAQTMRDSDLMLMTSISEGSPQVVKEAMACNLPVVSTKVGDVDVLLGGVNRSAWSESANSENIADLVYYSVYKDEPVGVPGRDKIFDLGLDHSSVSTQIYNLYCSLI